MTKNSILFLLFWGFFNHCCGQLSLLKGVVKDANTNELLSDARVRVMHLPLASATNHNGQFEISNVPLGELELLVTKPGYAFISLKANLKSTAAYIEIKLEKEYLPTLPPLIKELNKYREKVAVATDKPYYYPGEIVWLKAFFNYFDLALKDSLSRVVYLELINSNSNVIKRHMLSLDSGKLAGSILLPKNLTPGSYVLRAYTKFMLNFGERHFFTKLIPVLPLETSVDPSESMLGNESDFEIIADEEDYGLREPINLTLNKVPEGDYCVSVTDLRQVVPIRETVLKNDWGFAPNIQQEPVESIEYPVEKGVRFTGRSVSEYNTGKRITLSVFSQDLKETLEFVTDEKGWFQVNGLKFYDSMIFYYTGKIGKKGREFMGKILLSPEQENKPNLVVPGLWFKSQQMKSPQRSLADYLVPSEAILLNEVTVGGKRLESNQSTGIIGGADKIVKAESLNNFGNLLLSLQGKIPGLLINCTVNPCEVRFLRSLGTTVVGSSEPLVLVNNNPVGGSAGNTLQNIDINMVDRIEVSRRLNVLYGEQGRNGIIAVYLKEGYDRFSNPLSITPSFEIHGFNRPLTFVNPDYSKAEQDNNFSDLRSTLFWSPHLTRNPATGNYSCSFYSSDLPGKYRVVVQGITNDGKPVYAEEIFEVIDR